ncbi:hypothetical protein RchiOBHm_Chr4g0425081 [Rosa chinensis]|uniref:Cell division control protein 24 OB domain-containing protein n=1 Tax=Rosa chinensis TaxID=74649 RepID=A0A2P6QZ24_ROSCH|nr:hypothetical protein RchiOBHm_Chr4g0425081 [Rosa chinensis]
MFRFQLNRCHDSIEAIWSENTGGASFFNLISLPALLNSSCLHKLTKLSDLSSQTSCTQIVHIRLEMVQFHLSTRLSHAVCGHFVTEQPMGVSKCSFCNENCDEVIRTFHLKMTLADKSGGKFLHGVLVILLQRSCKYLLMNSLNYLRKNKLCIPLH